MSLFTLRCNTSKGDAVLAYSDIEAAGAIHGLWWNGMEIFNSGDDGRCMQSAVSCDGLQEAFNPTEGGSLASIQFAAPSLSDLLTHAIVGNELRTATRMAYWKPVNGVTLSNFALSKRVTFGANLITVTPRFSTPQSETHAQHQFEILTAYMNPALSRFFAVDRANSRLLPLLDGPGEQPYPVVFCTPNGSHATGCWIPAWGNTAPDTVKGGYGRWRFPPPDDVVKWNVVQRVNNPAPGMIFNAPQVYIPFGSLADVMATMCTPRGLLAWQIRRLYRTALKREADGGETYWTDQLQAGTSLVAIAAAFIASPEFGSLYGNTTDTQFVTLLYRNVLQRTPSSDELAYHVEALKTITRTQLVVNFSESPEYQVRSLLAGA